MRLEELEGRALLNGVWAHGSVVSNGFVDFETGFGVPVEVAARETRPGVNQVFVGAGFGGSPRVAGYDLDYNPVPFVNFFAFEEGFRGGVHVAEGDGLLVVGAGPGGAPRVRVFDSHTFAPVADFYAYEETFRGGVNVAVDRGEVVVGSGPGGGPSVATFTRDGRLLGVRLVGPADDRGGVGVASVNGEVHTLSAGMIDGRVPTTDTYIAAGYFSNNLGAHVVTSGGTVSHEWDLNPLFPTGRLTSSYPFDYAEPVRVGSNTQVSDGLDRFRLGGGLLDFDVLAIRGGQDYPLADYVAVGPPDGGTGTKTMLVAPGLALTNRHVVTNREGVREVGHEIDRPGPAFSGGSYYGAVDRWVPTTDPRADSALIRTDDTDDRSFYVRPDGSVGSIRATGLRGVAVGDHVYKWGFWDVKEGVVLATGQTTGVRDSDGSVRTFVGQSFAASLESGVSWIIPGDSGSLVTDRDGNRVGQVFAGSANVGVFTPLGAVFDALGLGR